MKLKVTYDKSKGKFYFNFSNNRHRSFYGLDAAIVFLQTRDKRMPYNAAKKLLLKCLYNNEIIKIEV